MENTTDKTFTSVSYEINLLDKDGVIIDSTGAYANNVGP
ncbi:MAG: FxLYD domain-containing protein [Oscillospiraceae bacterium]|nr:FxLYD domain-containing protein [Candidatus Ruminococcus equi]